MKENKKYWYEGITFEEAYELNEKLIHNAINRSFSVSSRASFFESHPELDYGDFYMAALMGFNEAYNKYDPKRCQFSTFVTTCIKRNIYKYFTRYDKFENKSSNVKFISNRYYDPSIMSLQGQVVGKRKTNGNGLIYDLSTFEVIDENSEETFISRFISEIRELSTKLKEINGIKESKYDLLMQILDLIEDELEEGNEIKIRQIEIKIFGDHKPKNYVKVQEAFYIIRLMTIMILDVNNIPYNKKILDKKYSKRNTGTSSIKYIEELILENNLLQPKDGLEMFN